MTLKVELIPVELGRRQKLSWVHVPGYMGLQYTLGAQTSHQHSVSTKAVIS